MLATTQPPKERILRAAQELFGEYGYFGTTFKRIADRADITLGLITHHFGTKENLYIECSLQVLESIFIRLDNRLENTANGFLAVVAFLEEYFACSTDSELNFMILVSSSPYSNAKVDLDRNDIEAKFNEVIDLLEHLIHRGMADGSIKECDAQRMAGIIFAMVVGSVRTNLLTPYAWDGFYTDVIRFASERLAADQR